MQVITGICIQPGLEQSNVGLYQTSFRLRHECPYRDLSEQYPDLTIREWYLSDCQVLEISSTNSPTDDLLADLEEIGTLLHKSVDESGIHVVMQSCLCSLEDSIIERFEEHNCLYQPPTVHRQGWEHYTVIAFDEADIRSLYDALKDDRHIEVLSKTGLEEGQLPHSMLAPVDQLFDGLTDRQLGALRVALDNGYYNQPRGASVSDLAAQTAVARSTYEEHLRKAENKLITNAGRFVRLLMGSDAGDALGVDRSSPKIAETD